MLTNMPERGLNLTFIILAIHRFLGPSLSSIKSLHMAFQPTSGYQHGKFRVYGGKSFDTPASLFPVNFAPSPHLGLVIPGHLSTSEIVHQHLDEATTHFPPPALSFIPFLLHISILILFFPQPSNPLQILPSFPSY